MNFTNLTLGQKIAMALVLLSAIGGGASQMAPVMGQAVATAIASLATLAATVVSGWMFIITGQQPMIQQVQNTTGGQGALVRTVMSMKGVEPLEVNKSAGPELAQLAIDPSLPKIVPKPSDVVAVTATASAQSNAG